MLKPQATPPFTKIRLGGMVADLEGYAYQIENSGEKPRAVLWYFSMVGHKTAVQAIWAGLVNSPPQSAVLYREEEEENTEAEGEEEQTNLTNEVIAPASGQSKSGSRPKAVMLQLAEGQRSGGWSFFKTQLNATSSYQGVLLPQVAFPTTLEKEMQRTKSSPTAPTSDKTSPIEFLLLSPPSLTSKNAVRSNSSVSQVLPQQLYYARLNSLSGLPLHPLWADTLWQRALDSGEIEPLECAGIEIYLCHTPDEELLRQEIADLVRLGKLSCQIN